MPIAIVIFFAIFFAPIFAVAHSEKFAAGTPIWTTAEQGEINSSIVFSTDFEWDGEGELKLRLTGCSLFKVFVNEKFAAYGPARGGHGYFRVDQWNIKPFARKGRNRLNIVGVAYNTTTFYIIDHEPFLQAEVVSGDNVLRATGDGRWCANLTGRIRRTQRYSAQRAQSEVYEVQSSHGWEWWKRCNDFGRVLSITNAPRVRLFERGAPYPTFEIDSSYRPTDSLSVKLREGDLGKIPDLWGGKASYLGRTYPSETLKYRPVIDWWKREFLPAGKIEQGPVKIDAQRAVRYEGKINNTGFLSVKVKVVKPGRIIVAFDEILVGGKLNFLKRFACNNVIMWDVKAPGEYEFESFEAYTFKFAEVMMLEGEAVVESLVMRTYKNPNATKKCMLSDVADVKIFEAARETFAQNALDVLMDCPSRERAAWLCDSYFTGEAEYFFTGKNEIERTFLRNFALADKFEFLPEGDDFDVLPGRSYQCKFYPQLVYVVYT